MTITQAIVKIRDDIISWCTLNFKKKADVSTTNEMQAKLDTLEPHPTYHGDATTSNFVTLGATQLELDYQGHVVGTSDGTYIVNVTPESDVEGISIATVNSTDEQGNVTIHAPTLSQMCAVEFIVLTKDKQYGKTTPANPVNGQLFFIEVEE